LCIQLEILGTSFRQVHITIAPLSLGEAADNSSHPIEVISVALLPGAQDASELKKKKSGYKNPRALSLAFGSGMLLKSLSTHRNITGLGLCCLDAPRSPQNTEPRRVMHDRFVRRIVLKEMSGQSK
jgi:hypothetical protein